MLDARCRVYISLRRFNSDKRQIDFLFNGRVLAYVVLVNFAAFSCCASLAFTRQNNYALNGILIFRYINRNLQ